MLRWSSCIRFIPQVNGQPPQVVVYRTRHDVVYFSQHQQQETWVGADYPSSLQIIADLLVHRYLLCRALPILQMQHFNHHHDRITIANAILSFSVFSDENEGVKSKITSSTKSAASVSSLPVPSKRIKMAPPSTGLYAASTAMNKSSLPLTYNNNSLRPRTALSTKSITVLADKENLDPTGKRKVSDKGKEEVKDNSKTSSFKPDLWQGKQPFEYASPEKIPTSSRTSSKTTSTKYIYDLPGVQACEHVTSTNASQTFLKPTSLRTIGSGIAVSKPNKKIRPAAPAPLKKTGAFEIFKDDGMTGSGRETFAIPRAASTSTLAPVNRDLELLGNQQAIAMRSPVSSIQASDRRARELTESPLADVTLAYTGNGRFSNSPTVSFCHNRIYTMCLLILMGFFSI